jgi:hypothetical protein
VFRIKIVIISCVRLLTVRLKSRWGCQNHPLARIATSLEGSAGVVGMSGQMLSMLEANRVLIFSIRLKGTKDVEKIACVKMKTRASAFDAMVVHFSTTIELLEVK